MKKYSKSQGTKRQIDGFYNFELVFRVQSYTSQMADESARITNDSPLTFESKAPSKIIVIIYYYSRCPLTNQQMLR
jgi:hypothetical protein